MLSELPPGRRLDLRLECLAIVLPPGGGALLRPPHGGGGLPRHRPLHLLLLLLPLRPALLLGLRLLRVPPVLDIGGVPPPGGGSLPPVGVAAARPLRLVILQSPELLLLQLREERP